MERRTALVAAIATGVSLTIGVVAFAAAGGASILGLGGDGHAAAGRAADPLVVHQVQTIDDEIVVSTRTTEVPRSVERTGATASGPASIPTPAFDGITVSIGPAAANVAPVVPAGATVSAAPNLDAPATGTGTGDGSPTASTTPAVSAAPSSSVNPAPASTNPPSAAPGTTAPSSTSPGSTTPATTSPATTTQTPTPTTAARPAGVPADWPTNKPIPPMPVDCQQPQLEDNGVWNCDH